MSAARFVLIALLIAASDAQGDDHPDFFQTGLASSPSKWMQPEARDRARVAAAHGKGGGGAIGLDINVGVSGSWYQPTFSGQGFIIDVIPSAQGFVLYWFTHAAVAPEDDREIQRWLTGLGNYAGDTAELVLYLNRGGRFAQPPAVGSVAVGTATVRFASCTRATIDYSVRENAVRGAGDPESGPLRTGTIELERLTPDVLCAPFEAPVTAAPVAFTGATVLPMNDDRILERQTVVVRDGTIVSIADDGAARLPPDAVVVAASGRWMVPGLVDFHVHEQPFQFWPDDVGGNFIMYLANSVTSIVSMGEFTGRIVDAGRRVRRGELAGPEVYAGLFARSPAEGGSPQTIASTAAQARALVRSARTLGYDFIKPYDGLATAVYDALMDEARIVGIAVLGHTNARLSLSAIFERGQDMVVHAVSLFGTYFGGRIDPSGLPGMAALVRNADVAIGPTLWVNHVITEIGLAALAGNDTLAVVYAQEGTEFMDDGSLAAWEGMLRDRPDVTTPVDRRPNEAFMRQMTLALQDAGVPLLAGTDVIGIPGVVPGFSIHGELEQLELAGLTRRQVLATATRTPGDFIRDNLRANERFGTIEPGARADIVLLDSDPLVSLAALRRPAGVMAAGRWYPGTWLRRELETLRTSR